ncbi:MAG: DUF4082 domain-containing protein, partial [Betaproteobacteria bacterium]
MFPALALAQQIVYPDLQVKVPVTEFSIGHPTPSTRELRYSHSTANFGAGPLDIAPSYNANSGVAQGYQRLFGYNGTTLVFVKQVPIVLPMVFVPPDDYRFPLAQFGLHADVGGALGPLVAPSPKELFCMTEGVKIGGVPNTPPTQVHNGGCRNPKAILGISVGWADNYDYLDPGQNINITGLRDGVYWLRAVADPYHYFLESNITNNATDTQIRIAGDTVTVLKQVIPNSTPPAVVVTAPLAGATVSGSVVLTANITGSVKTVQFLLDGNALPGTPVASGSSYSFTWNTAGLDGAHLLSVQATGTNSFINTAVGVPVTVSNPQTCPCTIWPASVAPVSIADLDHNPIEVGVKFRSDVPGTISGIRFYKSPDNTGPHVGTLWSLTGAVLARATFTAETASGWQQVNFSPAVAISANTTYIVSYHTNTGHYAGDNNFFTTKGVDRVPLHAQADGAGGTGPNGVYAYSSASLFPGNSWKSSNYWVDVVFNSGVIPPADTTPPAVTLLNPGLDQMLSGGVVLTARATDNVAVSSVQFSLDGTLLPGTVTASAPNYYSLKLDTTRFSNAPHTISVVATDSSNLSSAADSASAEVNNSPPPKSCFILDATTFARGFNSVTTSVFRTSLPGELLLAFVGADGPSTGGQTAIVSGTGLTWTLIRRANAQLGTSEVWQARAPAAMTGLTVTAKAVKTGFNVSVYVVALQGTDGVGVSAAASGRNTAPSVTLQTTKAGSLIYGVGNDWDRPAARTIGTNQILDYQWLDTKTGDAYWVQNETYPPLIPIGASVTLNDTAPVTDRWNF